MRTVCGAGDCDRPATCALQWRPDPAKAQTRAEPCCDVHRRSLTEVIKGRAGEAVHYGVRWLTLPEYAARLSRTTVRLTADDFKIFTS